MKLKNGSDVVIVGGGPSGTFSSILLSEYASQKDMHLNITILEKKSFLTEGPGGCNLCAGVVSSSLLDKLSEMNIKLPKHVIRREIHGYVFKMHNESLELEDKDKHIACVYRGNGPRKSDQKRIISFDYFLKDEAVKRGVNFVNTNVTSIKPPSSLEEKVKIHTEVPGKGNKDVYEAGLLVGALGMQGARILEKAGFGYRRAETVRLAQVEVPMEGEKINKLFGQYIHTYPFCIPGIRFIAITPKRRYITVTAISMNVSGKENDITIREKLKEFLDGFHNYIGDKTLSGTDEGGDVQNGIKIMEEPTCYCVPHIPYGDSRQPYGDRIVIVGDAAYSRLYKNGIEAAFTTADMAARTALEYGCSKKIFRKYYHKKADVMFNKDNRHAKIIFAINDIMSCSDEISKELMKIANSSTENGEILKRVFWSLFSGDRSYKEIFYDALRPSLLLNLGIATAKGVYMHYFKKK